MQGRRRARATPEMDSAILMACSSLSITHGPAMRNNSPPPISTLPTLNAVVSCQFPVVGSKSSTLFHPEDTEYTEESISAFQFQKQISFHLAIKIVVGQESSIFNQLCALCVLCGQQLSSSDLLWPQEQLHLRTLLLLPLLQSVLVGRSHERLEQGMRLQGLGLELRMELAAQEIWVPGYLYHLHVGAVRGRTRDAQPGGGQRPFILAVELVAVAVALADFELPIHFVRQRARLNFAGPGAQAHGAAQFLHAAQLAQLINDAVGRGGVEFAGVGVLQPANVARVLDACGLHTQADAEIRHLLFPGIADAVQHSGNAALPEAARHQDAVVILQLRLVAAVLPVLGFQALGFNPVHIDL